MTVKVVISKYNEDVSWVNSIIYETLIYDKSQNPIKNSIARPNVGREAETLLYYIITNYNFLPDLTIFLQGDPRSNPISYNYEEVLKEINQEHRLELRPLLSRDKGRVDLNQYWLKNCKVLNNLLFENDGDSVVEYSHGAQFIIPKNLIINRPLSLYEFLHEQIIKFGNNGLDGSKISLDLGIDAWTLEVIWGNIFNLDKKLKNSKYYI